MGGERAIIMDALFALAALSTPFFLLVVLTGLVAVVLPAVFK